MLSLRNLVLGLVILAAGFGIWRACRTNVHGTGLALRTSGGVWMVWSNLPSRWALEYAQELGPGVPVTNWMVLLAKTNAVMSLTNLELQVAGPNETKFWRLSPR